MELVNEAALAKEICVFKRANRHVLVIRGRARLGA